MELDDVRQIIESEGLYTHLIAEDGFPPFLSIGEETRYFGGSQVVTGHITGISYAHGQEMLWYVVFDSKIVRSSYDLEDVLEVVQSHYRIQGYFGEDNSLTGLIFRLYGNGFLPIVDNNGDIIIHILENPDETFDPPRFVLNMNDKDQETVLRVTPDGNFSMSNSEKDNVVLSSIKEVINWLK